MSIAVYTLTSPLHDAQAIEQYTKDFFSHLDFEFSYKGEDFSTYGQADLSLIFIRTGGTESLFKLKYMETPALKRTVYLLSSYSNNSLAASMEILSWLHQHGIKGEILHGSHQYISSRIKLLSVLETARKKLSSIRAAMIGRPSDWLISSAIDTDSIRRKLGFEIEQIEIEEIEKAYSEISGLSEEAKALNTLLFGKCNNTEGIAAEGATKSPSPENEQNQSSSSANDSCLSHNIPGAVRIYQALKKVIAEHNINAFTIRCFDLLSSLKSTGCAALAKLNSEGIVAGCEGDAPAMLSMIISQCLTGKTGFQANPSKIDIEKGEVLFAHCTIPLNMVERYELDTHFESGIGVGIRGYMKEGPVTVFKVSGDLQRFFAEEGELLENGKAANLCRTQQLIRFNDKDATKYFLQNPIGNHHIIIPGHWRKILTELL